MISMTELERMLFRCPEVNISKYPQATYEEFMLMDYDFSSEFVCVQHQRINIGTSNFSAGIHLQRLFSTRGICIRKVIHIPWPQKFLIQKKWIFT